MTFRDQLKNMGACRKSLEWVEDKTIEEAWKTCEKSQWMIWVLSQTDLDLIDPLCEIVEHVLDLDLAPEQEPEQEQACLDAIDAARRRVSKDELYAAAGAVCNDSGASYINCAAGALARYAARRDKLDANATADYAIANYATYHAVDAKYEKERKNQCDILRKYFTVDQVRAAFNKLVA
jgi:hypothetical protein